VSIWGKSSPAVGHQRHARWDIIELALTIEKSWRNCHSSKLQSRLRARALSQRTISKPLF